MIGPTNARSGWHRRPIVSALLRVAATLVPVVVSVAVAFVLNRVLPQASSTMVAVGRAAGLVVCSMGALVVTDALARRFLPLATLLQLSLVFPDQTPSRFKTALKGGSGRRLAREVENARRQGLSDDPTLAAEQLLMLATAMGDHDRRTRGHSERVRLYTELIAEELHMSGDERAKLQWAALIHDIGKIEVPSEILNKKGRPDAAEWLVLQRHPLAGERLAASVEPWLGDAVHAVGGHHERWDGTGYPRGLAGAEIPRAAAIVAVADAFEVMTAVRSYKPAMKLADARTELTRCSGTHFSPEVVRALLNVSIGRLRRSMGVLAALAHVPFLGQATKAAAYAPDTVSTAVGFTTSTATAGAGVLVAAGALAVASPAPSAGADAATIGSPRAGHESGVLVDAASTLPAVSNTYAPTVENAPSVAITELLAATPAPSDLDVPTIGPAAQSIAGAASGGPAATSHQPSVPGHDSHRKNDATGAKTAKHAKADVTAKDGKQVAADAKTAKQAKADVTAKDAKQDAADAKAARDEARHAKHDATAKDDPASDANNDARNGANENSVDAGNAGHGSGPAAAGPPVQPVPPVPPVPAEAPVAAAPAVAAAPSPVSPPVQAPTVKDGSNDNDAARNNGGSGGGGGGKPDG